MNASATNKSHAEANQLIGVHVPRHAWDSVVAIVVMQKPAVHLLGTGTLFQIAHQRFVITAAHVIRIAHEHGKTIGISDDSKSFISVHGEWISSSPVQFGSVEDPFDIAVFALPERSVERLAAKQFLRIDDINFGEQSATAVFSLFGYPGVWSSPSRREDEKVQLKPLEYTSYAYDGNVELLIGHQPKYHLLLDAQAKHATWTNGSQLVLTDRTGAAATFPRDLKGISGSTVWVIGDAKVPVNDWSARPPRVVGVQTGVYQPSQVIRATRWAAVTTLLAAAFPEMRRAMNL